MNGIHTYIYSERIRMYYQKQLYEKCLNSGNYSKLKYLSVFIQAMD